MKLRALLAGFASLALAFGVSACDADDDPPGLAPRDGPLERAGEALDEAVEDAGDAVEKAGDKVEDWTDPK